MSLGNRRNCETYIHKKTQSIKRVKHVNYFQKIGKQPKLSSVNWNQRSKTMSSPIKGPASGRLGSRSPNKKRVIDLLDFDNEDCTNNKILKLISPKKRSMKELNEIALKKTFNLKMRLLANDEDESDNEDIILADKIIQESKKDGLPPLLSELDHEGNEILEEEEEEEILQQTPIKKAKEAITPIQLTPKSKANPFTPTKSDRTSQTPKKKIIDPVGDKISPLKQSDLKPPEKLKLLPVPRLSRKNDVLLSLDKTNGSSLFYDGYEGFFEQQRIKTKKLSSNSMIMAPQLDYEKFNTYNKLMDVICGNEISNLHTFYKTQFPQWLLELQEGFSLIFYGVGSKRLLLLEFLQKFALAKTEKSKCLVVNGYNTECNARLLVKSIWDTTFKRRKTQKVTGTLYEQCRDIAKEFSKPSAKTLFLLISNIDGPSLKSEQTQYFLSELSTIPKVHLVCTLDNVNTPFMWNSTLLTNFKFIWHDLTTYSSYNAEISFKDSLSIGKSKEFVGSRGVKYVLNSLTSNARNLYKNLLLQQLEKIDSTISTEQEMENRGTMRGSNKYALEFKDFFRFCVSEFIISNEISFRAILGEFIEHKMCLLSRDTSGSEVLSIPFTVDEMEKLIEEEFLDD